jgi:benzoyl-CoA 2,3-dioxygenase component B
VGETGVGRIIERACTLMKQDPNGDARAQGGIDLATIQRYVNYWFSYSLDLFGSEISSNAADFFASGLKGRWKEDQYEDHRALEGSLRLAQVRDGALSDEDVPLRNAMNEVLRQEYVADCQRVVDRWNREISKAGLDESWFIRLPSTRFHRRQGIYANLPFDLQGNLIDSLSWQSRLRQWLPTPEDRAYVASLMHPVYQPGQMANWIAAPKRGINGQPVDWEYVRL